MERGQSQTLKLKPFWKSVSFWMGALVSAFIAWVWIDSESTQTWIGWHSYQTHSQNGSFDITYDKLRLFGQPFQFGREPTVPFLRDLPIIGRLFETQPSHQPVFWINTDGVWLRAGAQWWLINLTWFIIWLSSFTLYRHWQRKRMAARRL